MRRFLLACLGLLAAPAFAIPLVPRPATPEETARLQEAMLNSKQDTEHWAYTESTRIEGKKGAMLQEETIVRFDPSRPYEEQFTPLKVEGRTPTEKDFKRYRKKGEERHEKLLKRRPEVDREGARLIINDQVAHLDTGHPLVLQDDAARTVFEIPLRADRGGIPVEKFQITVTVDKSTRAVERAGLKVREAFRVKLVAKIKEGEVNIEFAAIDPAFGPVIAAVHGDFGASFLLIPLRGTFTSNRTEWKRVKAFDERFAVTLAPLQFLSH